MKSLIYSLYLCLITICGCTPKIELGPVRQSDILSDKIINTVSDRLKIAYDLNLIAIGGGEDEDGVWKITAMYARYGDKNSEIKIARKIIVSCVDEFLKEINNSEKFRPFMKVYPFTEKNLSLSIMNYDETRREVKFPYISCISMSEGLISYKSFGPKIKLPYAQKFTETFSEALVHLKED